MTGGTGLSSDLSPQSLFSFLSASDEDAAPPHNLLIAIDANATESWRDFAREFSLEFEGRGTSVVDAFRAGPRSEGGPIVAVKPTSVASKNILSDETLQGPAVLYRGQSHVIQPDFPLAMPVLSSSVSSYSAVSTSFSEDEPVPFSPSSLVTAVQATSGGRILWSGSVDLFSDAFFRDGLSGNEAFVKDVSQWVLAERGVLRVQDVRHRRVGEQESREQYRVKDEWVRLLCSC